MSVDPKVASFEHMELVITVSSITIRLVIIYRMPRSKETVNTDGEQLSVCDGVILLAGDFNVDWLNGKGLERRQLYNIFETFGFTQNINVATSKHHHLLDYIITRKHCEYISNFAVSHFISDHRALHASVRCIRLWLAIGVINHCFTRKVKCFTRKVKCFTRKVKCFTRIVKCFTRETKRFTRKVNRFTRKTKILLYFNTLFYA